jgi:hypothetical protein
MATVEFCCKTILSANTDGRMIFADMVVLIAKRMVSVKMSFFIDVSFG